MGRLRVVVIHNHQFRANIAKVDAVYAGRFRDLVHLVPFYSGDEPHVIPVYENSFHFQGYVAQGARHFISDEIDHYLFIADDLIVNPVVTDETYEREFGIDSAASFISTFLPLPHLSVYWIRAEEALRWRLGISGVEAGGELPSASMAAALIAGNDLEGDRVSLRGLMALTRPRLGLPRSRVTTRQMLRHNKWAVIGWVRTARTLAWIARRGRRLSYPLVGGYADIFVVPRSAIRSFAHFCGVFAATDLHVELAIPTALVLSGSRVRTDEALPRRGRALWGDEVRELDRYEGSLKRLLDEFPSDRLFVHPVKLSRWDMTGVL